MMYIHSNNETVPWAHSSAHANGTSIGSAVFAGLAGLSNRHTERQTDTVSRPHLYMRSGLNIRFVERRKSDTHQSVQLTETNWSKFFFFSGNLHDSVSCGVSFLFT